MSDTPIFDALAAGDQPSQTAAAPAFPVGIPELVAELETCAFFADGTKRGDLVPLAHFMRHRIAAAMREAGTMLKATQRVEQGGSAGVAAIFEERDRHTSALGHSQVKDVGRADELISAAQAFIDSAIYGPDGFHDRNGPVAPPTWPWGEASWRPTDNPVPALAKAGALIAAAIDSLMVPLDHRTRAQRRDEHLVRRVTT